MELNKITKGMSNAAEAIDQNFTTVEQNIDEQGDKITAVEALARNGDLAGGSDLNDIESGIWAIFASRTYTNLPSGFTTGILFVLPTNSGAFLAQIFLGATAIRTRIRTGALPGTWTDWR